MKNQFKIVFIGPDDSGKTTLINFFKKKFEEDGKTVDCFFFGWRNFKNPLLKIFSIFYLKNKKEDKTKERIDRYKERSWIFYLIYYSELWLRYLRVLLSNKDYVLFDRYFYDELLFSQGYKSKFFAKLTPRPDLCIVLKPKLITLKKRGQKVSQEKLNYFYDKLDKVSKFCKSIDINDVKSPENVFNLVRKYYTAN